MNKFSLNETYLFKISSINLYSYTYIIFSVITRYILVNEYLK